MKQEIIEDYLLEVGILPHLKGFGYLVEAVQTYKPGMAFFMELYPAIAKTYGSTTSKVERCIRTAIYKSGNKIPTSQYIAYAAIKCKRKQKEEVSQ